MPMTAAARKHWPRESRAEASEVHGTRRAPHPARRDDRTRTGALARYAVVWCRWIEAEAEVKRRGAVVKTEGGNIIQNPFLAVANKCLLQIAQIEGEFGTTPSSRSRI